MLNANDFYCIGQPIYKSGVVAILYRKKYHIINKNIKLLLRITLFRI